MYNISSRKNPSANAIAWLNLLNESGIIRNLNEIIKSLKPSVCLHMTLCPLIDRSQVPLWTSNQALINCTAETSKNKVVNQNIYHRVNTSTVEVFSVTLSGSPIDWTRDASFSSSFFHNSRASASILKWNTHIRVTRNNNSPKQRQKY